jgi:hypothetical protein
MSVTTSWARRNPELAVQSFRIRGKLTDAQKATRKISRVFNQQKTADLAADLTQYQMDCEEKLSDLAEKHACKTECIVRLLNTSSTFKKQRKPSLYNAMLHKKAVLENGGAL